MRALRSSIPCGPRRGRSGSAATWSSISPPLRAALTSYFEHVGISSIPAAGRDCGSRTCDGGKGALHEPRLGNFRARTEAIRLQGSGVDQRFCRTRVRRRGACQGRFAHHRSRARGARAGHRSRSSVPVPDSASPAWHGTRIASYPWRPRAATWDSRRAIDEELEVLRVLSKQFGRVSIERVLSGPGARITVSGVGDRYTDVRLRR